MGWAEKRVQKYSQGERGTFFEKMVLGYANPVTLALGVIGYVLAFYGLWVHELRWVVYGIGLNAVGALYVYHRGWPAKKIEMYRQGQKANWLERRVLEHAHPVHWVLAVVGLALIVYGLWMHAWLWIIIGVVLNIIGHTYTSLQK